MDLLKIIGVGIVTAIAVVVVKQVKTEFAVIVGLAGSVIMLIMIINQLSGVISYLSQIVTKTNIDIGLFNCILKIIGIGYLTEFASGICIEMGSPSIASKVALAGKVVILCLALPIITSLLNIIVGILPWKKN